MHPIYVKLEWVVFKICSSACTHVVNIDLSRRTIKCPVFSLIVLESESKHNIKTIKTSNIKTIKTSNIKMIKTSNIKSIKTSNIKTIKSSNIKTIKTIKTSEVDKLSSECLTVIFWKK